MTGDPDPKTEELKLDQAARETLERQRASQAALDEETGAHDRRADKAAYLKEKLEERERAEREG